MITKFHKFWISIFIISVIVWFFWMSQYSAIQKKNSRHVLNVNLSQEILRKLRENEDIKAENEKLENILIDKKSASKKNEYVKEKYDNLMKDLAYTDVEWEYVKLELNWEVDVYSLTDLIHTFWFANAKAISINKNRINSRSFFSLIENEVYIDWNKISSPINIEVIWDKKQIEKYLTQPDWIIKHLEDKGVIVNFFLKDFFRIE